ncbi:thioesterase II family protein [Streptomyces bobili]|uniref:thioesterase II family protein n=1 Tax=Streptomyces bobili TaxID=67280 RepID=UPI003794463B
MAYELALRLEARGIVPEHLLVSAHEAPRRAERMTLHRADDETLITRVRHLGDLHSDPELRDLLLPALRADYRLIEGYQPPHPTPVRAPITAYVGQDDPSCLLDHVLAWSELAAPGRFELRSFPGDHFYLTPREAEVVADMAAGFARGSGTNHPWQ